MTTPGSHEKFFSCRHKKQDTTITISLMGGDCSAGRLVPSPEPSTQSAKISVFGVLKVKQRRFEFRGQPGSMIFKRRAPSRRKQNIAVTQHMSVTVRVQERCSCAPQQDLETRRWEHPAVTPIFSCWVTAQQDTEPAIKWKAWKPIPQRREDCKFFYRGGLGRQDTLPAPSAACKQPKQWPSQSRRKLTQLLLSSLLAHRNYAAFGTACTMALVSSAQRPWRNVLCYPQNPKN